MVKQIDRDQQAEVLNDFIDALIMEYKPVPPPQMNQDLSAMFETVRGIKRLRSEKEVLYDAGEGLAHLSDRDESEEKGRTGIFTSIKPWMKWASAAAALFLVAGAITMQQLGDRTEDMSPMSMEMAPQESFAGLYAMAEAYDRLDNYQGTLEVRYELPDHGWTETVEITYEKPDKFYTVTRQEDQTTFTRIYDGGDQLISFHGDGSQGVMVDYMGPELLDMYLSDYHVGSLLNEIQSAPEVNEIGTQMINGREAFIYEYRYDPDAPFHRAWIDQSLQLPVKMETNFIDGSSVVREFTRLAIDVPIESHYFAFDLSEIDEVYYASREAEDSARIAGNEETMAAADAPEAADMPSSAEERTFSAAADVDVHYSSAVFVRHFDSYYVQMRLIGSPEVFEEFKLSETLRRQWQGKTIETGSLFSVAFETGVNEVPVLTMLEPVDQISLTAAYLGRADTNFGEFKINDQVIVIALSESVQSVVETLDSERTASQTRIPVSITIEASSFSTSGMITSIERIRE